MSKFANSLGFLQKRSFGTQTKQRRVNQPIQAAIKAIPKFNPKKNQSPTKLSPKHYESSWTPDQIKDETQKHALMTWGPTGLYLRFQTHFFFLFFFVD